MNEFLRVYSQVGTVVRFTLRGSEHTVGPYGEFPPLTEAQVALLKSRGMQIALLPVTAEQRASVRTRELSESNTDDRILSLKRKLEVAVAGEQAAGRAAEEAAAQQRAAESARDKAEAELRTANERAGRLQADLDQLVGRVADGKVAAEQSAELEETKAALKGALAELAQLRSAGDEAVAAKAKLDGETARLQEAEARLTRDVEAARAEAAEAARQADERVKAALAAHDDEQFKLLTRIEQLSGLLQANGVEVPPEQSSESQGAAASPEEPTKDESSKPAKSKAKRG